MSSPMGEYERELLKPAHVPGEYVREPGMSLKEYLVLIPFWLTFMLLFWGCVAGVIVVDVQVRLP